MEEESQAGTGRDPLGETPGLGRGGVSRSEAAPARRAPAAGSSRSQEMGCLAPRFTKDQRKQSEAQDAAGARGQGCSLPQLRRTDPPGFRPSAAAGLRPPLASAPRRPPTPAGGGGRGSRWGAGAGGRDRTSRHTRAPPPGRPGARPPAAPPPLCGGRCCPGDGAAPPGPAPRCAESGSPRGSPPRRSPQEPPPAAGRDSGAVAGSAARLSAPVLSPALACSPRRSAGRNRRTSSPSGSQPRLRGRLRDPPTARPCPPLVRLSAPCR